MDKLSTTLEGYLDAVYELSLPGKSGARLTDVAGRLGVTKSTASAAMAALEGKSLVQYGRYKHIQLTQEGEALARAITKKHETIRRFFSEVLGIDEGTADMDACAIEHVISDMAVLAMQASLGAMAPSAEALKTAGEDQDAGR
jgi:Mn-dependent DtxR family transcriptional regulator